MQNLRISRIAANAVLSLGLTGYWLCPGTPGFAQTAESAAKFQVSNPVTARFEDGPPLGSLRLLPSEVVYFSFTAANFRRSETGKVDITGHVQIFDPSGTAISPKEEIPLITTLSEEDRNWVPKLRTEIALPPIAQPGTYKVKFDATDDQSHQSASGEAAFGVEAKFVAPSGVLAVRELNFYRNQEDTTALITPSSRAGDMVWVKFYITGYKYGGENSIDVAYDVELLAPDGTSILKQENASMEKSMAYYPQPYIPAVFNMTLKSTMTRTVYTLVITARDDMGRQTATARSKFQVN